MGSVIYKYEVSRQLRILHNEELCDSDCLLLWK